MKVDGTLQILHVYLLRWKEQHPRPGLIRLEALALLTPPTIAVYSRDSAYSSLYFDPLAAGQLEIVAVL